MDTVAPESFDVVVVEVGQDAALVQVAVLDDLEDGQVLAQLGDGQQLGFSVQLLLGHGADVVPGLAFASAAALVAEKVVVHSTESTRSAGSRVFQRMFWRIKSHSLP